MAITINGYASLSDPKKWVAGMCWSITVVRVTYSIPFSIIF